MKELTKIDKDVLRLLADGMTSKQIAVEIDFSENVVNVARIRLMRKLRAMNTAQLVSEGYKQKILEV